jgi:hypothetical protein
LHQLLHNSPDRIVALQLPMSDDLANLAMKLFVEGTRGFFQSHKGGLKQLLVKSYSDKQLISCSIFELLLVVIDDALFDLVQFVLEFCLYLLQVLD